MSKFRRVQIYLELNQYEDLKKIAYMQNRSVSDLVQGILEEWLILSKSGIRTDRELQALDQLTLLRKKIEDQHGTYPGDLLNDAREERDQDIERVWRGESWAFSIRIGL